MRSPRQKERRQVAHLAVAVSRRYTLDGDQVHVDLNPALLAEVDRLVGRYGDSREEVCVFLIMHAISMRGSRA